MEKTDELLPCPNCKGNGWYQDHHPSCQYPCECGGIQSECEVCKGKGVNDGKN